MFLTQDLSLLFLVPSEREKTRDLFPSLKKKNKLESWHEVQKNTSSVIF